MISPMEEGRSGDVAVGQNWGPWVAWGRLKPALRAFNRLKPGLHASCGDPERSGWPVISPGLVGLLRITCQEGGQFVAGLREVGCEPQGFAVLDDGIIRSFLSDEGHRKPIVETGFVRS
jgi:hypothetical protein